MAASAQKENRIKFALHHQRWSYENDSPNQLRIEAVKVLATDYQPKMEGKLFCPVCTTNLVRTPKDKSIFSNGRRACFSHLHKYVGIPCDLRSKKPEGKTYLNEEEVRQAIESNDLVVISSFMEKPPETAGLSSGIYDQSSVEDLEGPTTEVAIGRHNGQKFSVPTKLATVHSICRNFDDNLYKYYVFPESNAAVRLIDALTDAASIETKEATPRLYFGRIISSRNAGINPKPTNLRLSWLKHHESVKDLCIKDTDAVQLSKGINDDSAGRIVLFWGRITESGIGLCINRPGWGEYGLLPTKYNDLIPEHNRK
ncbi:hypothetical protein [Hydrogenophaga sp.]|uniref:hypothetical protein n=1 Tax=Hydrogenophaga sp. TaxID=1904254 RepID=UPI0027314551|nr:hypothetical protein [Hydrogenophaga sp.]MDP1686470.1 hypothetical protein [Hydrogenophaga sp.]